ncbi:3719_t:CDS:2, partial [Cetraspora pellucida]
PNQPRKSITEWVLEKAQQNNTLSAYLKHSQMTNIQILDITEEYMDVVADFQKDDSKIELENRFMVLLRVPFNER